MTTQRIPFNDVHLREDAAEVEAAIRRVVERGWFILGPEVEAFEHEFAAACGAATAVGVGTGTDAIALILMALGIGRGDEVITTPLSAAYSSLAIMMAGARPVFVDIDAARLTLDPAGIEAAITPRTRAILPVHLYGQPADMDAVMRVADRHRLAVVEDCAQSHLATCGGRPAGTIGVAGAFSFYPTKNLGALGDGGAVVTGDEQLAARIRRIRNGGQSRRYHHDEYGVNSRLDEIQAAVLRERLRFLPTWTEKRRALARTYRESLAGAPVVVPPEFDPGHVYHLFPVLSEDRARLQQYLGARGIETLIHYPVPIPRQPALSATHPAACPNADRTCGQLLSLPLYPSLALAQARATGEAVRSFAAGTAN